MRRRYQIYFLIEYCHAEIDAHAMRKNSYHGSFSYRGTHKMKNSGYYGRFTCRDSNAEIPMQRCRYIEKE